jgi:lipopolysaccharide/colanic/teichoic acid biosynthesis glycosyltransferase
MHLKLHTVPQDVRSRREQKLYSRFGKRLLDLALTVPALLLLSPVMALVALLVRLKLGSPVLFRHQRPGIDGRPFILLKFRTMTDARDANGECYLTSSALRSSAKRFGAAALMNSLS